MSKDCLHVILAGTPAGLLYREESGLLSFEYHPTYSGVPLSVSMPVSNRTYKDRVVRPYLSGLMPGNSAVRRRIANAWGVMPNDPFDLLSVVGLDCLGAVQFCTEDTFERVVAGKGRLAKLSDSDIAKRLRGIQLESPEPQSGISERWLLGGEQRKIALAKTKSGEWASCKGASPTTYIIKPSSAGAPYQALNEHLCMRLAEECKIPVARTEYHTFEDQTTSIVERFDRIAMPNGRIARLHQEDFCQACGVAPENRYAQFGGPDARDIAHVLKRTSSDPNRDTARFCLMLFFDYLVGSIDIHAQRFSLLLGADGKTVLGPLYGVPSKYPYVEGRGRLRLAMSIGGQSVVGKLSKANVKRFAETCGLPSVGISVLDCMDILQDLATRMPEALNKVLTEAKASGINPEGVEWLAERLRPAIEDTCVKTLGKIG